MHSDVYSILSGREGGSVTLAGDTPSEFALVMTIKESIFCCASPENDVVMATRCFPAVEIAKVKTEKPQDSQEVASGILGLQKHDWRGYPSKLWVRIQLSPPAQHTTHGLRRLGNSLGKRGKTS